MISTVEKDGIVELYGLSTDTKPTPAPGTIPYKNKPIVFYEIDTHKLYMYDYDGRTWIEQ